LLNYVAEFGLMRVLVTWSSKRGGTAGIGRILGQELAASGFDVVAVPVREVKSLAGFEAAIVGGALYANCWPAAARRFVNRHVRQLRRIPVWFFSSGPLDDSADRRAIPATRQVSALAERIGAQDHVTFGGRLDRQATGFPARAMARKKAGDWRNADVIRAWASKIAVALPTARAHPGWDRRARCVGRLLAFGAAGWAACAATQLVLVQSVARAPALVVHAVAAPFFFVLIARQYFGQPGPRDPLPTAVTWTLLSGGLDLVVAGVVLRSTNMFHGIVGTWLPLTSIFLATWITGLVMWMRPRD